MKKRSAKITRKTKETDIKLSFVVDGKGEATVNTGIPFFDHMLLSFARHGFFDMNLVCKGDIEVDSHHTVEDCGIVLGNAIKDALKDKAGIKRYGSVILPMDESLVLCAVDLSGRPYLNFDADFAMAKVGDLETETVKEFFYALSYSVGMNLHIKVLENGNTHHVIEAMFKAFAKALSEAVTGDARISGQLSAKGLLS